jgi:hypothetical protein
MQPTEEKVEALRAAKELLSRNDDKLFRYVALELRRCVEAVVYEKLLVYRDWIPPEVARTWQPPQAFKALLKMDPEAQETSTLAIALQPQPNVPAPGPYTTLGVDQRPKLGWLTKTWNKLGQHLHAAWPFAQSRKPVSIEECKFAADSSGRV